MLMHTGVLLALLGALFANGGAQLANLAAELAVERHELGRGLADGHAVDVRADARRHHLYVVSRQTAVDTVAAGRGAFLTCLDTFLNLFLGHNGLVC